MTTPITDEMREKARPLREEAAIRAALRSGRAREIRVEAGVPLADFAAALGEASPTVSRWEHGRRAPRSEAARRYAALLRELTRPDSQETL